MTTLIGQRCKSGNIFSRLILIGRGLFLIPQGGVKFEKSLTKRVSVRENTEREAKVLKNGTLRKRRCERNVSEVSEAIYDCTGAIASGNKS